ncbi:transposable element Tcb2 transposase [Trichonephila clavipes]|nr:transposable element Tcb2 transposase [Trichonephila clavipes]
MEWPTCSPDMNPIEHVWDALGRQIAGRKPPPQILQEQERALLEEWDRIPQLVINSPIDSMPQSYNTTLIINRTNYQDKCKEQLPAPGNRSNERRYREKDLATTEEKKVGTGEKREGDEKSRGREK